MRHLLIFLLLLLAVWWLRGVVRRLRQGASARPSAEARLPEPMLACRQCGVHVPQSEGVREGDAFFCCEAHRREFAQR